MADIYYGYFYDAHDLFSGVGWGAQMRELGLIELGVDNDPEVLHLRDANHMQTLYADLWHSIPSLVEPKIRRLLGSPTCKTFSIAGGQEGLAHLETLREMVAQVAAGASVRSIAAHFNPEVALVLTPLEWIVHHRPERILLEQVVQVLPIWDAYANELSRMGYSTAVATLDAERYGAAQTRSRAYLMAKLDAFARFPAPTHSKFHYQRPDRLDPDVLPWVSAHDALNLDADIYSMQSNYSSGNRGQRLGTRNVSLPSSTITTKTYSCKWLDHDGKVVRPISIEEMAALQGFPATLDWSSLGNKAAAKLIGNAVEGTIANALIRTMMED